MLRLTFPSFFGKSSNRAVDRKMSEFKLKSTTPKRLYLYVNPYTHDYEISNIPPRYQVYHTGNYVGSFLSHQHFAEKGVYRITRVLDQATFDKRHRVDDVTTNICFTCDRSGHWASQCPEKENQMWRFVFVFVNTHTHDVEIHPIKEMDWDSQHMKYVGSLLSYKVDENKRKTKPSQPTTLSSGKGQSSQQKTQNNKQRIQKSSGSEEKKINDKINDKSNDPTPEKQIENQIEREIENMEFDNTEISDTEICRIQIDYPVKKKTSSGKLSSEKKISEQSSQKASSASGEGKDKKLSSEKKEDTIILDQKSGEAQNNEQTVQKSSGSEEKKISDKSSAIGDNQINDKINDKINKKSSSGKPSSVPGEGKNKKLSSEKKIRREGKKICSDIELRRRWKSDVVNEKFLKAKKHSAKSCPTIVLKNNKDKNNDIKNNEKKRKSECEPDIPKKKRKLCL